jgi:hypothetical protein
MCTVITADQAFRELYERACGRGPKLTAERIAEIEVVKKRQREMHCERQGRHQQQQEEIEAAIAAASFHAAEKFEATQARARSICLLDPPPLTSAECQVADEADAARGRVEARITGLYQQRAVRALYCGKGATHHLRRDEGGAVEDALIRFSCGKSSCPHCWRRRLTKTYRRATRCLLDAPAEPDQPGKPGRKNLPRLGSVHVALCDWMKWEALDKAIRRRHGGDCGRLRVRRFDNRLLVVAAHPFPGSTPRTPAEALDEAAAFVGELHTHRHSYRQLGDWSDRAKPRWRLLGRYQRSFDYDAIKQFLDEAGFRSRRIKQRDMAGLFWRVQQGEDIANKLAARLLSEFGQEEESGCANSDSPAAEPDSASGEEDFDPGETPWG